jgi:hypothetical protein
MMFLLAEKHLSRREAGLDVMACLTALAVGFVAFPGLKIQTWGTHLRVD